MEKYVLLILAGISLLSPANGANLTEVPSGCGQFWHQDPSSGKCYRIGEAKNAWLASREYCQKLAGRNHKADLCSINSYQEQLFVNSLLASRNIPTAWNGFTDLNEEGNWQWIDGSDVTYTNWLPGEPNDWLGEDCCEMIYPSYKWNDIRCDGWKYPCCEKDPAPLVCADGKEAFCYFPPSDRFGDDYYVYQEKDEYIHPDCSCEDGSEPQIGDEN